MVASAQTAKGSDPCQGCRRTAISGSRAWWCNAFPNGSEPRGAAEWTPPAA